MSITRSRWLGTEGANQQRPSTWLWPLSARMTAVIEASCNRCWNTDAYTFSSHHRSHKMESPLPVLPCRWEAVYVSDTCCVEAVSRQTREGARIHSPVRHGGRRAIKARDVTRTAEGRGCDIDGLPPFYPPTRTAIMDSVGNCPETPLLYSPHISHRLGIDTYLKLEVFTVVSGKLGRLSPPISEPPAFSIVQVSGDIPLHPTV